MSYENPEVPHEVNVARESAVAEFLRLLAGIGIVVLAIAVLLYFSAAWLARQVPYETERDWVGERVIGIDVGATTPRNGAAIQRYLQTLTESLARDMPLPTGMQVRVHYTQNDAANAFATLGGNIIVTSALYERMPSENALAMVLGHELGHLAARDPIAAAGGGVTIALVSAALGGDASALTGGIAALVQRGYSRAAETAADELAIDALRRHYGHAGGAAALFEVLAAQRPAALERVPSLLATHPADAERIAHVADAATNWNPAHSPLRALAIPTQR